MNEKLPYYMAYPMRFSFDDERIERMDLEVCIRRFRNGFFRM
mgnify:CR=1 FL=1